MNLPEELELSRRDRKALRSYLRVLFTINSTNKRELLYGDGAAAEMAK